MPLISVIIPTCHRNDLLAKCLDCLAPGIQTLPPDQYEVIVTDDGSLSTAEQLMRENYPWAQWVSGPRKGPAANRNNGAALAQGEWLAFTDDDCLPSQGWLEAFHTSIQPDIFVYEGKTTCEAGLHSPLQDAPINLTGGALWSCNMLIRKDIFCTLGGFDEKFPHPHMEDADLRDRLKRQKLIFLFVQQSIVDHPPKRVPWGDRLGAFHECEIYFNYKLGGLREASLTLVVLRVIKWRLKKISIFPISKDTFVAIFSLIVELHFLLIHFHSWQNKYSAIFSKQAALQVLPE